MNEEEAKALFLLAGFNVTRFHRLENQYWPEAYVEERKRSPWWLALTEFGPIKIGWRKRVISINWEDTPSRVLVTEDDVTKEPTLVHAWSYVKALEYLTTLAAAQHAVRAALSAPVTTEK
jgi:hypothetical protein